MKKLLQIIIFITLDIFLFVSLLFSSVQVVVYNDSYFKWHYENHNIEEETGMTVEGLMEVTDKMMDYLIDKRDTLDMQGVINGQTEEVFGEREKAHMVDVKDLFLQGKQFRDLSAITLLIAIVYMFASRKKWLRDWLGQLKMFFITSFILVGIVGGLFASNFNKYFTIFHEVFFDNDLWLLDPRTDILINMVPEIFFFQTSMLILTGFVAAILIILTVSKLVIGKLNEIIV